MTIQLNLKDLKKTIFPIMTYQEEMRTAITSLEQLNRYFNISLSSVNYKIFMPLPLAKKILAKGNQSALWKQFIPSISEDKISLQDKGLIDPIGDHRHQKAGPLIHRYKNRVLFFPTNICPVACRYCFRKNELEDSPELFKQDYQQSLQYISEHPEVNEIIFSGGDPFILSDQKLEKYLADFSQIEHIKFIRFHTRVPTIMPSRITNNLILLLKKQIKKILIVIHTNHKDELDGSVQNALIKLNRAPIQLLSQSVLLKGINDNAQTLFELVEKLVELNIRPYYLHHPDQVKGAMHFYLPLEQGRKIYNKLKSKLSGWACPQYIIDIPRGEGKTQAYNPENFQYSGKLINSNGQEISAPTP